MQPRRATRYEVSWTIGLFVGEGVLLGSPAIQVAVAVVLAWRLLPALV
jgi:hypothetical protein